MKPPRWTPRVELSKFEERLVKVMKSRHLLAFLRLHRHELFDDAFQDELAGMYEVHAKGRVPHPPALLAMVMLLQAYSGLSDVETVDQACFDARWRMVLGLGPVTEDDDPPFAQGVLPSFRRRMMAHDMDRRLLERTVELARETGEFGHKNLRLALDASPLFTASRVEDTFNLIGHAARKVLVAAAVALGRTASDAESLAVEAGIPLLAADPEAKGGSLKARLDVAWEKPEERTRALGRLVGEVEALRRWLSSNPALTAEPVAAAWKVVQDILDQDIEPDPTGAPTVKEGVAAERRPSIEDGEARHGRKSRSQKFVGYKRHLAVDLDSKLVLAVAVAPANKPEGAITSAVSVDLARVVGVTNASAVATRIASLHVDRAYLSSLLTREVRAAGGVVLCRPLSPASLGGRYSKSAFNLDLRAGVGTITCPAGVEVQAIPGHTARFPASRCQNCPVQEACTTSKRGRTVGIHPDEAFFQQLRERQATPEGRAALRERTAVEHKLSRQVRVQGRRARYRTTRKNLMATRVGATVVNLHTLFQQERKREAARHTA